MGRKFSRANSCEEDLKDGNFVREGLEKGVEAHLSGEVEPFFPRGDGGSGSLRRHSLDDCFLRRAESIAETNCDPRVQT